jgi:uncharacterized protein (DUF1015 family)
MDYNRVFRSLNGLTPDQFIKKLEEYYTVQEFSNPALYIVRPKKRHECSLYIGGKWYKCKVKLEYVPKNNLIKSLDV